MTTTLTTLTSSRRCDQQQYTTSRRHRRRRSFRRLSRRRGRVVGSTRDDDDDDERANHRHRHRHRHHHHNLWSATTTAQSDEDEEGVLSAFQTTPRWSASVALAGALFLSTPRIADAVTENQLVFMEAWRAVDKAYVDKTFNGVSWFKYREQTVKNTPMPSREDAYEEIKKMLKKLDDPFTRFLGTRSIRRGEREYDERKRERHRGGVDHRFRLERESSHTDD